MGAFRLRHSIQVLQMVKEVLAVLPRIGHWRDDPTGTTGDNLGVRGPKAGTAALQHSQDHRGDSTGREAVL